MAIGAFQSPPQPKLLKRTYLAEGEFLHRETRATKLFYFPGPVVAFLFFLFLDFTSAGAVYGSFPRVPFLTDLFGNLSKLTSRLPYYAFLFLAFITFLIFLWIVVRYIRWRSTVYAVTDHRVIVQRGILSRDVNEIPVNQVRGVDVHQTPWQRILGYGTIRVSAEEGTGMGNEDWLGVPKPFEFQRIVEGVMQNLTNPRVVYVPGGGSPPAPPPAAPPPPRS